MSLHLADQQLYARAGSNGGAAVTYTPTAAVSILFLVVFALSTAAHLAQAFRYKTWFMLPTAVLGGLMEAIGWGARFGISRTTEIRNPYIIQSVVLILGPTPLLAANFVIVGRIFLRLGEGYSRLRPTWYTKVFLTGDIVSLLIQAAGGALAAMSIIKGTPDATGSNIVLVGVLFQLVVLLFFIFLALEFSWRFSKQNPLRQCSRGVATRRMKFLAIALTVNTLALLIRGIFRTVEFIDGWSGSIANTEWMFVVFEGLMITIAIVALNVVHPGPVLTESIEAKEGDMQLQSIP